MSSTQHQLIEQCATRLRGIVEALDNIHDNTPHRWSTDLDDVHSSAESLLAMIKDQAPARSEASFEEWLANELESEDGQPVPAAVCDIALARRAFNHWPKLEQPAKVGGVRFSAGVSSRLVVEAAQRLYEFESTPEQEAERPEVVAYRTIGRHTKHQHPHYALNYYKQNAEDQAAHWRERGCEVSEDELMTVAQHERIVGALRAERDGAIKLLGQSVWQKIERLTQERDAALARVEQQERTIAGINEAHAKLAGLYEAAQAQHSAGYAEARQCVNCRHIGINDAADYAACHDCRWTGPEPDEDKCPGCAGENCMAAACPECGGRYELVAEAKISTPAAQAGQMPQAWLDVQAERRRQITAEGWTPEHDDEHSHGQMARAAACYALAGSSAPNDGTAALLVSLAWPWDQQWWKPTSARRDLIKAGALILAEIERLDRAAPGKEVGHE
ncbi:hypothetical protein ACEPYH_13915 [Pseudomonas aeruginosa]|uniref:hypothetical protein n=1 Tax=Pseudomonas aeruginosa TaxID=287 RepID=UPI000A625B0E|nr:hypothetical protein [Pseudomonas aeruginosa]MCR3871392.1 hypothetical protein [Pseudomonas aeruginosa]SPY82386.1 Uncharacterised protein [Pseudomonas aeruginosa]